MVDAQSVPNRCSLNRRSERHSYSGVYVSLESGVTLSSTPMTPLRETMELTLIWLHVNYSFALGGIWVPPTASVAAG